MTLPHEMPRETEPSPTVPLWRQVAGPLAILCAGVLLLAVLSACEARYLSTDPWRDAFLAEKGDPLWDDVISARVRRVPMGNFPTRAAFLQGIRDALPMGGPVELSGRSPGECVVMAELPPERWQSLCVSGRLPEPGKHEVLAGDLVRLQEFSMDGVRFRVVGRLRRDVPAFTFAYALPYDSAMETFFGAETGATAGWLAPDGLARLRLKDPAELETIAEKPGIIVPVARVSPVIGVLAILGLGLVVWGGAAAQIRFLRWLKPCLPTLGSVLGEFSLSPELLWSCHGLCYGVLFLFMSAALLFPVPSLA